MRSPKHRQIDRMFLTAHVGFDVSIFYAEAADNSQNMQGDDMGGIHGRESLGGQELQQVERLMYPLELKEAEIAF